MAVPTSRALREAAMVAGCRNPAHAQGWQIETREDPAQFRVIVSKMCRVCGEAGAAVVSMQAVLEDADQQDRQSADRTAPSGFPWYAKGIGDFFVPNEAFERLLRADRKKRGATISSPPIQAPSPASNPASSTAPKRKPPKAQPPTPPVVWEWQPPAEAGAIPLPDEPPKEDVLMTTTIIADPLAPPGMLYGVRTKDLPDGGTMFERRFKMTYLAMTTTDGTNTPLLPPSEVILWEPTNNLPPPPGPPELPARLPPRLPEWQPPTMPGPLPLLDEPKEGTIP